MSKTFLPPFGGELFAANFVVKEYVKNIDLDVGCKTPQDMFNFIQDTVENELSDFPHDVQLNEVSIALKLIGERPDLVNAWFKV